MITTNLVPSSRIKNFESVLALRLPVAYPRYKRERPSDDKNLEDQSEQENCNPFKDWCMPKIESGYLKPSKNDLL